MLAMGGLTASFALADTASSTATSTATTTVTATTTATSSSTIAGLLATLQSLIARVHQLQQQILGVQSQVGNLLNSNYQMGSSSPEIKKIQELLASDSSIYPQGITSGYFGSLTSAAISRFQQKNGLPVTGTLDTATKALLQTYLNQATSTIPSGFLSNGDVQSEVEKSFSAHCHEMEYGDGQFCGQVQAQLSHGFDLGSGTASSSFGEQMQQNIQDRVESQFASSSSNSDFQSWWAPFLQKIRGDHGNSGDNGQSHSNGDSSSSNSSSSSDN